MFDSIQLIDRDLKHIWHPCTQMKDFESHPPLIIKQAQGSYIESDKGLLIDGISSWWCKSLGHKHPQVIAAISEQLNQFEHVISANTTHPKLIELGEQLAKITKKQHAFFASDGSSAVEIALKLALHANHIKGTPCKNQFIALKNGYHGETLACLSVSDLGIYKAPYPSTLLETHILNSIPYVSGIDDPLWSDCSSIWANIETQLDQLAEHVCAVILEPIIQGAGGMLCYSADFLKRIASWAKKNKIFLIADEIMTGIGRTGKWLACEHAAVDPDIICLSKGLTSGSIPFSCIMIDHSIFELFYNDYDPLKSFLHSHTYSGNSLGVSAALATIKIIQDEDIMSHSNIIGEYMLKCMRAIAQQTGKLSRVRGIGALVAADVEPIKNQRISILLAQHAQSLGALLRPIGNTLYWLPPLNTSKEIIGKLSEITLHSIEAVYAKAKKL